MATGLQLSAAVIWAVIDKGYCPAVVGALLTFNRKDLAGLCRDPLAVDVASLLEERGIIELQRFATSSVLVDGVCMNKEPHLQLLGTRRETAGGC